VADHRGPGSTSPAGLADGLIVTDGPDYILDIASLREDAGDDQPSRPARERPWVGIHFECCGVYLRVYRNREGTAYQANCPRCGLPVRLRVGPGGTSERIFRAS